MGKKSPNTAERRNLLLPYVSVLVFIAFWQLAVFFFKIEKWILPAPIAVFKSFAGSLDLIVLHTGRTVYEAVTGLVVGGLLGVIVAFAIDWSGNLKRIIYPFLLLTQSVPFIVLAPLLVVWFGYGLTSKIILVSLVCFFPVAVNVELGLSKTGNSYLRLLKSFGAGRWQIMRFVKIPYARPYFFTGLRIAASYSVLSAVISEWIGSDRGLGILLLRSAKSYETDRVFAVVVIISVLSLLAVKSVDYIQNKSLGHYGISN